MPSASAASIIAREDRDDVKFHDRTRVDPVPFRSSSPSGGSITIVRAARSIADANLSGQRNQHLAPAAVHDQPAAPDRPFDVASRGRSRRRPSFARGTRPVRAGRTSRPATRAAPRRHAQLGVRQRLRLVHRLDAAHRDDRPAPLKPHRRHHQRLDPPLPPHVDSRSHPEPLLREIGFGVHDRPGRDFRAPRTRPPRPSRPTPSCIFSRLPIPDLQRDLPFAALRRRDQRAHAPRSSGPAARYPATSGGATDISMRIVPRCSTSVTHALRVVRQRPGHDFDDVAKVAHDAGGPPAGGRPRPRHPPAPRRSRDERAACAPYPTAAPRGRPSRRSAPSSFTLAGFVRGL